MIEVSIILAWDFAVPLRWNHDGLTRLLPRFNHPLIGIIALVRDEGIGFQSGQEFVRSRQAAGLPRSQNKPGRIP